MRTLGMLTFLIIVLLISWSGIKVIQSNYVFQKQISGLEQENALRRLENENLKLKNEYYGTPQYLEIAARQNFGLGAPGEKELLVPKEVALKYVENVPTDETASPAKKAHDKQPFYHRNLQAWKDFFLHRTSSSD